MNFGLNIKLTLLGIKQQIKMVILQRRDEVFIYIYHKYIYIIYLYDSQVEIIHLKIVKFRYYKNYNNMLRICIRYVNSININYHKGVYYYYMIIVNRNLKLV